MPTVSHEVLEVGRSKAEVMRRLVEQIVIRGTRMDLYY
jgi:hypothetical protein